MLVHLFISRVEAIQYGFRYIVAAIEPAPTSESFQALKKKLAKSPTNICIALTEQADPTNVARVVSWCAMLGIPQISIWDRKGIGEQRAGDVEGGAV